MALYRGFKAEAERIAVATRGELGLGCYQRIDPLDLARHLDVPVISLTELAAAAVTSDALEAVGLLLSSESSALSAVTVFDGTRRLIVHNDSHLPGRQNSNLAHELSHGLLLHPAAPVLDRNGCRNWNADLEDEANYLPGALLIPEKAAFAIASRGQSLEQAAHEYGCSEEMVRWRINVTGAKKKVERMKQKSK